MHRSNSFTAALFALPCFIIPATSQASCGASFCAVNTDWSAQGVFAEPGGRAELRYEYLRQDQLRAGSRKVSPGEVPSEHEELYTRNQALFGSVDYNLGDWGLSLIVPLLQREHEHLHEDEALPESWNFRGVGDLRVAGRRQWQWASDDAARSQSFGLLAGLKLPTGSTTRSNADGEAAERSLQPGSGTTDAFAGAFYQIGWLEHGASAFAQGVYGAALNRYEGFRPGNRFAMDLGLRYELAPACSALLQLNALWRGRDSGAQAEPEDSGGRYLFLSPGLSFTLGRDLQFFALAQLPLYQYVNGVQLTSSWGATAGVALRF